MLKKLMVVIVALMMALNSASCASKPENNRYEAEFLTLFDTVTRIVGYAESKEAFTDQAQFVHDSLEEYHQLYDIYNDYEGINNVKTINEQAGKAPVKVDPRIIDLLLFSKESYELTDGQLNVAMGAVLKIWHDYRTEGIDNPEKAKLPAVEQLEEAAKHADINKVIIDKENSTVFLADPEMSLDVGGVAKGYATEQVAQLAAQHGINSMLISVGGNVRAIGIRGDGTSWRVGVQNPIDQDGANVCDVNLIDASLVTSGTYERYYIVDGVKYHHIIDPDTLFPARYFASVTILCKDSGKADALAKIFNMPYEEGLALIESLPDTEALWVLEDGSLKYSSGFPISD
ncbi:FAD:protein FMN transferase [Aminipila butyrica]|nr:FAD:protein FMN transferase [Aminipila butyrica]